MGADVSTINPYIRVAMHSVLNSGTRICDRIIFDYELIYIAKGEFVLTVDKNDYKCTKGQFLLLRPGISHRFWQINSELSQPHIHFDITHLPDSRQVPVCFKDMGDLSEQEKRMIRKDIFAQYPKTPFVVFSDREAALRLFYGIVEQPRNSVLAQKAMLIQLIDMLITDNFPELFSVGESGLGSVEIQVKDFLDAGQGVASSLEDIARQFNYSKYHLERRFKERYGVSLISYRNSKRMQLAKILLQRGTVSETAEELGFSSIYAFSRAFKNYFGISPRNIKKAR